MQITHDTLRDAILNIREELVGSGEFADYSSINRGYCADFAQEVSEFLCEDIRNPSIEVLGVDQFLVPAPDVGFNDGNPLDRGLLQTHWAAVQPTHGLTWDELDVLSAAAGFTGGTHIFMCFNGRFYDSEAPDGVANFLELPFFERVVTGWIASGKPGSDDDGSVYDMFGLSGLSCGMTNLDGAYRR